MRVSDGDVAQEVLGGVVDSGVAKLFEGEALAGVFDAAGKRPTGAKERNLHVLAGVEMRAIFHGVQQDLLESRDDALRNVGISNATKELNQALRRGNVTASRQANPRGGGGKDFDTVIPARRSHGGAHHIGELASIEGSRKITEGSFAHGRNDVPWSKAIGEENQAEVSASSSNL